MIHYLEPTVFHSYGTLPEAFPNVPPPGLRAAHVDRSLNGLNRYPGWEVWLQRESGIPVLQVADGNIPTSFYLDRPVKLRTDTWFSLTFFTEGRVKLWIPAEATRERRPMDIPERIAPLTPTLQLQQIFAFFYQEQEKGFVFPGDRHAPCELVYVDRGSLHSLAGGEDHLLRQGEMILYPPGRGHMLYVDERAAFLTIAFEMDWPDAGLLAGRPLATGQGDRQLIEEMLAEWKRGSYLQADLLQCHLKELLLLTLSRELEAEADEEGRPAGKNDQENGIIRAAREYIEAHIERPLSVTDVAQGVSVSASHLSALFRKHLSLSPGRYIQRTKLDASKRLLREGTHNLTEVSRMLGYTTLPHFSRSFKAEYGITPSEYVRASRQACSGTAV